MGNQGTPGKPTTRRYSQEDKARAVRLVRQLRKELGTKGRPPALRRDRLGQRLPLAHLQSHARAYRCPEPSPGRRAVDARIPR